MSSEQREFKCVFCSEIFSQKEDLQIHFRKHGDPNFNLKKCKGRSQDEADVSTDIPKDQVEVVECDVCSEVFSTISKAITHKHKVHPDQITKYFCSWCGKLFTMKHLYNKHMVSSHSEMENSVRKIFHCDSCNVDFNIPGAMLYHNKFYHRQEELPTLGHSKKLKMILEEVVQIYYCPFCGEEYENKVNLHKHMTDDHNCENQSPDDVFRCPLCDAIFYYLDAYELHLTYHSNEDLYTERNEMMDEITDFSLDTVQPMQEKVETAELLNIPTALGIEELLEFTMNDTPDNSIRKPKKHKKHKKSKKPAITLDEFFNMNKDVFGEGIDVQGVEEIPTQAVTKRLKTKKPVSVSKVVSSDIAKLKRQGIVVRKQTTKPGKPVTLNKEAIQSAIKHQKNVKSLPQNKPNTLTSTDDVLSKLLNQGSQIKVVKKSNHDNSEEQVQKQEDNITEECLSPKNNVENINYKDPVSDEAEDTENSKASIDMKSPKVNSIKNMSLAPSSNPESPSVIGDNHELNALLMTKEKTNDCSKFEDKIEEFSEKATNLSDNSNVLRINNGDNALKLSNKHESENKSDSEENGHVDVAYKELNAKETDDKTAIPSEKSSLNALKHLSHLITIKPVNSTQTTQPPNENKIENGLPKADTAKASNKTQNNSKTPETISLTNLKNLGSITIKSTHLNINTSKNQEFAKTGDDVEEDETDDERDEDKYNLINTGKLTNTLKSPQLSVETKKSPITLPKESPKRTFNNENSQSSADLLKHLKNVTAKPVNIKSHKIPNPKCSPSNNRITTSKTTVQKEVNEDGIEIFSIDDSDSDDANCHKVTRNLPFNTECTTENKNKSTMVLKNINKNISIKPNNQQCKTVKKEAKNCDQEIDDGDDECDDNDDEKETRINAPYNSPKPNQKQAAINNVLKNLSKNITVKSRNSSPSLSVQAQDHNSRDSHLETDEAEIDSDSPLSRVKITEMENMSDDEFPEDNAVTSPQGNVKVEHPDDSFSDQDDGPMVEDPEDFDDMADVESVITAVKVAKCNSRPNSSSMNLNKEVTIKSSNNQSNANSNQDNSVTSQEIPAFAKNLSNQISIKQVKKPDINKNAQLVEQTASRSNVQSSVNQQIASSSSNQVNTINKETKTVKTFKTQTKTVIQEITTTVTKTIKTVNQTMKQEVRNIAQSSSAPTIPQKVQGLNANFAQKNFQGVKVRQSMPSVRPKIRGQAPLPVRPAICAPPQGTRPAICAPIRASNQLVPVRPALNRPSGPRARMPTVMNMRASTSGQQRPQVRRPVKVSPAAVFSSPKKPAEPTGHFSCFKKPKESLIPEPDFPMMKNDGESSVQFSSAHQMSKSNFSSTTKMVKGNSVVTSTHMKSEMSASSQQLSKLRGMSGLSVVKTSQNQAKQMQVEEKTEMSASKRGALEAIQKLQSQGLLVKKPRLDVSEESDHSEPGSDDMGNHSNEEFDE